MPRRRSSKPPTGSAYEAAVRYLAGRAHSRAELARKLARRGHEEADVEGAMARLADLGYLDDAGFAAGHVRRRSASLGPLALSAELTARGVDRDVAQLALAGLSREAQLEAATRLAAKDAGRKRPAGYKELLDSAGPKLLRRGFSPGIAREACRLVWFGTSERAQSPGLEA